jgi:hypothetical protein
MELAEIMRWRPVPAAGLLLVLTERCPLGCAHCSTMSTMDGRDLVADEVRRFVGSFGPADRPEIVLMTGGEPLLRPGLVTELAVSARRAGARAAILTGGFFARGGRRPALVMAALGALDHVSVSVDRYHAGKLATADALSLVGDVIDLGIAASLHVTVTGDDDPYPAELAGQVRRRLGADLPMLVTAVRPLGRAAGWVRGGEPGAASAGVSPCAMAAWPVVTADGTVVACCNQDTVDRRPVPPHLLLGHISREDWRAVRSRTLGAPALRAIRAVGPTHLAGASAGTRGFCATCRRLSDQPSALATAERIGGGPAGALLDRYAARRQVDAGPVALARRYGSGAHAGRLIPEVVS